MLFLVIPTVLFAWIERIRLEMVVGTKACQRSSYRSSASPQWLEVRH